MKGQYYVVIAVLGFFCCCYTFAEEEQRWIWSSVGNNRRAHAFRDERYERIRDDVYARAEREPTTKRPVPGSPLNEEIDDYPQNDDTSLGIREYPFAPNSLNGGQIGGVDAGGSFNNYPGKGGFGGNPLSNGILVGPGGPTGIIGRPQYFPDGAGGGGGFSGAFGQHGLGFPQQQQSGGFNFGGFGQSLGHPGAQQGAQYPGGYFSGVQFQKTGQYPPGNQFRGAHFPGASNVQYPGSNQYPPTFSEGYGLFNPNQGGIGLPQTPFGGFNGFGAGFNEQQPTKRKLQAVEKSAAIQSRSIVGGTVNDKISRNIKKSA